MDKPAISADGHLVIVGAEDGVYQRYIIQDLSTCGPRMLVVIVLQTWSVLRLYKPPRR